MKLSEKEAGTMKRKMTLLTAILAILLVFVQPQYAQAADANNLETLIAQLPEVSDPMGTQYYFYNQLTDLEKVMYWKMSEATWSNPTITISGLSEYSRDELKRSADRTLTALMADQPRYRLRWQRYTGVSVNSFDGGDLILSMHRDTHISDYQIRKAEARIRQIVATVGQDGDLYSRVRDLLQLMHAQMDYDLYSAYYDSIKLAYNDSAVGALVYGNAICGGLSDTFKILCDALNIPCITVGNAGHAWNFVRMEDGKWYSTDPAFNHPGSDFRWDYYLIGSDSDTYRQESNYHLSELYLWHGKDFAFPTLNKSSYVYSGSYAPTYHNVQLSFTEPNPTFLYRVNADGKSCTVTGYQGPQTGDLVVPEKIDGYDVTAIGDMAFYQCNGFTGKLVIPDAVTEIGIGAFMQCSGLTGTLNLPKNLKSIDAYAFIGDSKLSGSLILPDGLVSIDTRIAYSVTNPESVASPFYDCTGLTGTLHIPDGLLIDAILIRNTGLTGYSISDTNQNYAICDQVLYTKDMTVLLAAFPSKTNALTIPKGVLRIAESACASRKFALGELVLPEGLQTIERGAFAFTSFTGNLIIPDSVTEIGEHAFKYCGFDGVLKLPANLKRIENSTFFACPLRGPLELPASLTYIGDNAFVQSQFDNKITVPAQVAYVGSDFAPFHESLEFQCTFLGNAPKFHYRTFCGIHTTVFYPKDASGWSGVSHSNYDVPSIEWIPVCGNHSLSTWETTKEATVNAEGEKHRICQNSGCGYYETEVIPKREPYTDWVQEEGVWYYYKEGVMQTGLQWIDGKVYYFADNGWMQRGYHTVNGVLYYFGRDGAGITEWGTNGIETWYFKDGVRVTGWNFIDGYWYYMGNGTMWTGWLRTDTHQYYLHTDGKMASGITQIDGTTYCFGSGGALQTGWVKIDSDWYYADSDGIIQTGWQTIGGYKYYFTSDGKMATGITKINSESYCFATGGALQTGWVKIGSDWYYADSNGIIQTGWQTINGYKYYFASNGKMATGATKIDGKIYCFNSGGTLAKGWVQVGGKWYYANSAGVAQTGWVSAGGKWYYMDANGIMQTGLKQIGGKYYYFTSGGVMTTGWQNVNGVRHLFNSKGAAVSGWYTENGRWYFLKANGAVTTGWMQDGGYWYFMDKSTGVMKTGWVTDGGYWYYMNKSGVMQTGWIQDGSYWYYMNKSGVMVTGTQVINGKTYKFNSSGVWIG